MAQDSYKLLEWGLEKESCLQIKSQSLGTVVQFREKEFLVLGQKEITRFESTIVKESYPYVLTALVPVPKYDILIGVTAVSAEFIILFMSDLKKNIMTGVKINDQSVFNIIFSASSNTIITSGEHLMTWSFHFTSPESSVVFVYPKIKISMRNVILSHIHSSIMNPPMFDYTREELYVNDNKGNIQSYNLDGTSNGAAIKYGSSSQTQCGFFENSQYFMTTNTNQGAVLWPKKTRGISKRFYIGTSASLAIQFIDDEYVAILDAKYSITIIDVKTSNFFNCYQSDIPVHRMFYFAKPYPRIVLCAGGSVILLKANLPWRFWNPTFGKPLSITRSNKENEAARITVVLENSHVRLISPKTSCVLTAATLTSLSTPISCFYDRGQGSQTKRDQLLIPLQDGSMQIFNTGQDPCQMIGSIDFKITSICQCKFRDDLSFCFGTNVGQLLFYSYSTMKPLGRIVCNYKYPIIGIFYDKESECLIISFEERACLISLIQEKEVGDYLNTPISKISLFFDRIAIYATDHGLITSLYVLNQQLLFHETNSMRLHDDSITSFSLGSTFFVSSSLDKSIKVWSKEFNVMCKLVFPLPLLQCCVMNGKRDILIATLNEIMITKGEDIFGENIDLEDEIYDNYDRKTDFLDNSILMFKEEEEKEESVFAGRKKKNDPKKSRINARRRRIIEALKKQLSMSQEQNLKFEDFDETDNRPNNMINLPYDKFPRPPDQENKEKKLSSQKPKTSDEYSYEYILEEEEEDKKSGFSQSVEIESNRSQNETEDSKVNKTDDMIKLLEKQKADKEKEILKAFNDARRENAIKEPKTQARTRPSRPRAPQPKVPTQSSNDTENDKNSESFSVTKKSENESKSSKNISENDQNANKKLNEKKTDTDKEKKMNSGKNSELNPDSINKKEAENQKNKGKNKTKSDSNSIDKDSHNKNKENDKQKTNKKGNNNQNKDQNANKSKNDNTNRSKTQNTSKNINDNTNKSKSDNTNKSKSDNTNKSKSDSTNKNKSDNTNKSKSDSTNKNKSDSTNKSKDQNTSKNINDNLNKNKNDQNKDQNTSKHNENEDTNKNSENEKKATNKTNKKPQQLPSRLLKKGYKNTASQTVDPSSLRKIGNIPKTVPNDIAIVPQVAKARRVRRSPTPPTYRPQRERRPLFDPAAAHRRSRTPDPFRFLVDGSAPPVNLFFDINMVRKMAENGDKRYASLLRLLERQGLKSSKFPSFSPKPPSNSPFYMNSRNKRREVKYSTPSWGVMVTLPPINVSQIKMSKQADHIIIQSSQLKKLDEEVLKDQQPNTLPSNDNNNEDENHEASQKHYTNHQRESFVRFPDEKEFSNDALNRPSFLLDNQVLPMKKVHKSSAHSRGASVPNLNKTVAEMNFCKEQLMLKIKEKREREAAQSDDLNSNETKVDFEEEDNNKNYEEERKNQAQYKTNIDRHSLNFNPKFPNPDIQIPESARGPTFVEPIMPIYLRSSKDARYIRQRGISPFACKRYRMVVDSNGPKDVKSFHAYHNPSKNVNNINSNNKSPKTLIDQYVRAPRQLLKPLQMVKARPKH